MHFVSHDKDGVRYKPWPDRKLSAEQGTIGFPAGGFKGACVDAVTFMNGTGLTKVFVRGAFYIQGKILPLRWSYMEKNEDVVRNKFTRGAALAYRPYFYDWECDLPILYNASQISLEQIVNIIQHAGFHVGIGEWRPEKEGSNGMFRVKTD